MRRGLLVLLALAVLSGAGVAATSAAFTDSAVNGGNAVTTGTVQLTADTSATALWAVEGMRPGDSVTRCVAVTYAGTLPATVRLFTPTPFGADASSHLTLRVEVGEVAGARTAPACGRFTPRSPALFDGTLKGFATTHGTPGGGVIATPAGKATWGTGDVVVYRLRLALPADASGPDLLVPTPTHGLSWRAENA